jgi:hypothetical protein
MSPPTNSPRVAGEHILPMEISWRRRTESKPARRLRLRQGQPGCQSKVQALLLTHCNGKVIEASVRGPVSKVDTVDCPQHQEGREPAFGEISSRREAENTYSIFCDECLGPETANGCPVLRMQEPPPRSTSEVWTLAIAVLRAGKWGLSSRCGTS